MVLRHAATNCRGVSSPGVMPVLLCFVLGDVTLPGCRGLEVIKLCLLPGRCGSGYTEDTSSSHVCNVLSLGPEQSEN